MAPYKKPNTLYTIATSAFSEVIAAKCEELDVMCKNPEGEFETITRPLRDTLQAIIPHALYNDICAAVLAWFDDRVTMKKCHEIILYGVLANVKLTRLNCRARTNESLSILIEIVPQWKNLVNLDINSSPYQELFNHDEFVSAISNSCPKLEMIALPLGPTSAEPFFSLLKSCTKLRSIKGFGSLPDKILRVALMKLPHLEDIVDCHNMAAILQSLRNHGPFNLLSVREEEATPDNTRAIVNLCPHLRELELGHIDECASGKILGTLTSSQLKLSKIKFCYLDLCNANAVRFLKAKGEYIEHLNICNCQISDMLNLINLIGVYCKNLSQLEISIAGRRNVTSSFKFQMPSDDKPSFLGLRKLCIAHFDIYSGNHNVRDIEAIATIMATATSIREIDICIESWTSGGVDEDAIERIFPIDSMQRLRHLKFSTLKMTERMARYFMTNAPELSSLVKSSCLCSKEAERYMLETVQRYKDQNMIFQLCHY